MKKLYRIFLLSLFIIISQYCFAQAKLDSMINQLRQPDFIKFYYVIDSITNYQKQAIPKLINLLKDTSYVKLINTADLIYPGAKEFYGHGRIVKYDIDYVSQRAVWILEGITFQDFGYLNSNISEDSLIEIHKRDYKNYLQKGFHDVNLKNTTPREQLVAYRLMLAGRVEKWWKKNKKNWTRFNALKEALKSTNENRQALALIFLGYDKTKCDGLSCDSYLKDLRPLIRKIHDSKSSQKQYTNVYLFGDPNVFLRFHKL